MNGLIRKSLLLRSAIVLAVSAVASIASAQLSGAIYTSLGNGETVNQNTYQAKEDVYLNGGPQNQNSAGLPDGEYFYQVTDPSGVDLLSTDDIRNRRLQVVNGVVFGSKADPVDPLTYPGHLDGSINPANGSKPVQLMPYLDTTNAGGEYKVWLTPVADYNPGSGHHGFGPSNVKTDNFKVIAGDPFPEQAVLSGIKFYDTDHDGELDPTEPRLGDWEIHVFATIDGVTDEYVVFTDPTGRYSIAVDENTPFEICEIIPNADPAWTQSYPEEGDVVGPATADEDQCWGGVVGTEDVGDLNFGNYREVTLSGFKFYDANANGENDSEDGVAGIRINVYAIDPDNNETLIDPLNQGYTTVTDADGNWTFSFDYFGYEGYTFRVEEVVPGTGEPNCYWLQTYPTNGTYTVSTNATNLDFGNVCICNETNGRTLGFWSNRNGKAILDGTAGAWLALLNPQPLRDASGADVSFGNYAAFRTWLLNGTAVNMAYMLSVQLAASELNVAYNGLADDHELILPAHLADCYGQPTANLADVHAAALDSLALYGYTPDGHAQREYQECLKDILDMSNNNLLPYIHGGPCEVVYP